MSRGIPRIGVAGWDYPDWNGVVYPRRPGRDFDRLTYIARYVDVVEINSSFYSPVPPRNAESWLRRTEGVEGFRFTAKAHRSWTHEANADPQRAVAETVRGLAPLYEADRLGALLVQFPQSFHFTDANLGRIDRLLGLAPAWPLAVEVRHASWETEEAATWFRDRAVGWCAVDQPRVSDSTARMLPRVTGSVGYLRLHGRNTASWFRPGAGRDARYDFLYDGEQLGALIDPINEMARSTAEMFVVQNNHFRGQALVNALQLKHLVAGVRPAAPEELVATYPQLAPHVEVQRRRLF